MTSVSFGLRAPQTRRAFLTLATSPVVACCLACSAHAGEPVSPTQSFAEVTADEILIRLASVPAFDRPGSVLVIYQANVIVLYWSALDYRAFSNICTHAGCGISLFIEDRFRCQCHGSEFDVSGANVTGPALLPLKRYAVSLDANAGVLRIDRKS